MRLQRRGIVRGLAVAGFVFATTVLRAAEVAGTIHADEPGPQISAPVRAMSSTTRFACGKNGRKRRK